MAFPEKINSILNDPKKYNMLMSAIMTRATLQDIADKFEISIFSANRLKKRFLEQYDLTKTDKGELRLKYITEYETNTTAMLKSYWKIYAESKDNNTKIKAMDSINKLLISIKDTYSELGILELKPQEINVNHKNTDSLFAEYLQGKISREEYKDRIKSENPIVVFESE